MILSPFFSTGLVSGALLFGLQGGAGAAAETLTDEGTTMKSLTPILIVEEIEPCLDFWLKLGFEKLDEVPHEDRLGFVILGRGNLQVMYQSRASIAEDIPVLSKSSKASSTILYFRVQNLDQIIPLLQSAPVVVPLRTTFYGAREIFVREPAGNVVAFAEFSDSD